MYQSLVATKSRNKLAATIIQDSKANKLYQDSIALKIKSEWREAADKLSQCAEIYNQLKMYLESATFYTEAAEAYMKVDKGEGLRAYRQSAKVYCDFGRFDIAGKIERKIAYVNYYSKHWEEASFHFRKAANFLSGDKLLEQSDLCLDKSAECLIELGQFTEACKIFEIIAISCVNSNLRRLCAKAYLLKAIICIAGIPTKDSVTTPHHDKKDSDTSELEVMTFSNATEKYDQIIIKCFDYEGIDFIWKNSVEYTFVKNIVSARLNVDLNSFIDHLYYWYGAKGFTGYEIKLVKCILNEIRKEKNLMDSKKIDELPPVPVKKQISADDDK